MTIKRFIEKAIEGGWKLHTGATVVDISDAGILYTYKKSPELGKFTHIIEEMLLDPEAWKAVGKSHGRPWQSLFLGLFQSLISGKTIEQYLEML